MAPVPEATSVKTSLEVPTTSFEVGKNRSVDVAANATELFSSHHFFVHSLTLVSHCPIENWYPANRASHRPYGRRPSRISHQPECCW